MITQQEWDKFSKQTKYLSKNFDRVAILQVVSKCGLQGGLSFFEKWPQGVINYSFKMRFRRSNYNQGAIFVFNDYCINNEPFSGLSIAYREYNTSVFGLEYVADCEQFLKQEVSNLCERLDVNVSTQRLTEDFLQKVNAETKRLYKILNKKNEAELVAGV